MKQAAFSVVDFFCGAGGFSEGFRQQGFEIILGIDSWKPAIDTFNHNFKKDFKTKNILDFSDSIDEINSLPDSDVIIGSPPCVSFSNSNKSGKADKSLGVKLTECFLRVVAVKKHKPNSKLKAWFMENVKNSKKYLQKHYTFNDLNLTTWAEENGINPSDVAIVLEGNGSIINSADYGSIQARKRLITGEIININKFILPPVTHKDPAKKLNEELFERNKNLPNYRTLKILKECLPSPFDNNINGIVEDPTYKFFIPKRNLSDHFYDTGIYRCEWENSYYLKVNHPYMGKMSFPENISKPSRTVTATNIGSSREALIYKSEIERIGNGQYRTPTVREAAIIMGFPITFQFMGSEGAKIRLVGNAVCPSVSSALAKVVRESYGLGVYETLIIDKVPNLDGVNNLNTYELDTFENPPKKKKNSKFRRHTFKSGNMTIALSNFDIINKSNEVGEWRVTAFYGTGEGFGTTFYKENFYKVLEPIIHNVFDDGKNFTDIINNGFSDKVASKQLLQEMYDNQTSIEKYLGPAELIDEVAKIIQDFDNKNEFYIQTDIDIFSKKIVPKNQLYSLYALNKIISITNK